MPMYSSSPRTSEPNRFAWFSVETPAVFREYRLPLHGYETRTEKRQRKELEAIAEVHGTSVKVHGYRRG